VVQALPVATRPRTPDLVPIITRLEGAKGPAARRSSLAAALPGVTDSSQRTQLLLEASRIQVEAVLTKVDGLKTDAAKKRNLLAVRDEIRSDPDDLQAQQVRWLDVEEALAELGKAEEP
jgi:hypothetical protein